MDADRARAAMPEDAWGRLGAEPGLCRTCRFPRFTRTTRGPVYLRCSRAAWDERLRRYPRLPVTECVGWEQVVPGRSGTERRAPVD